MEPDCEGFCPPNPICKGEGCKPAPDCLETECPKTCSDPKKCYNVIEYPCDECRGKLPCKGTDCNNLPEPSPICGDHTCNVCKGPECNYIFRPPFIIWILCENYDCTIIHCEGKDCRPNPECPKGTKTCVPNICVGPKCDIILPKKECNKENNFCFPA